MSSNDFPSVKYVRPASNRIWWVVGFAALLLILVLGVAARVAFASLPPGTTIAGVGVRSPQDVVRVAGDISARLNLLPVQITTAAGSSTVGAGRLGATLQTDGLRELAEDMTGFDAWSQRYTGGGPQQIQIGVEVAGGDLADVVQAVSREPVDGAVQITAGGVDVTDPVVGVDVTADQIRQAVTGPLMELADMPAQEWPSQLEISIEAEEIAPQVTQASVDAVLSDIQRITSDPFELTAQIVPEDGQTVDSVGIPTREDKTLTLSGPEIRSLLGVQTDLDAIQRNRLQVVANTTAPPPSLIEFLDEADVPPDMLIQVRNRSATPPRTPPAATAEQVDPETPVEPGIAASAQTEPGVGPGGPADQPRLSDVSGVTGDLDAQVINPGLEVDLEATIFGIVRAALDGRAEAEVLGRPVSDADPALLGITSPVSTYTTFYTPGEGRVTNIHRIAELLDGALIPPGGNFDVNHAAGERTPEGGFVPAGAILEGEFITDVGGGVSQFGTTFFNAMWFAGVDIITHTPHSFWFDRYPAGREATIDYPGVNLELNNNTPYWILVDTAVTDDSVTVTLWSTPYFEVTQSIGPREPVPGEDFRISISREAVAPAIPELETEAITDSDRFTTTYGAR